VATRKTKRHKIIAGMAMFDALEELEDMIFQVDLHRPFKRSKETFTCGRYWP